ADDPDALVLLELRRHLADDEVGGHAGLERRRRREEHARERGAEDAQQRDAAERREHAPAEAPEDVAPGPEGPHRRLFFRALLAFLLLLDAALIGDARLLFGR